MPDEPEIKRAVSFIDGQNLFRHAKDAFGHHHPNYDPGRLADAVCAANGWDPAATDRLEERHHALWRAARANHVAENRKLVEHRVQSLTISHRARSKVLEDQIESATDEKIRRMKEGELARADRDCERRIEDLKRLADSADIHATLVVQGVLTITRVDAA